MAKEQRLVDTFLPSGVEEDELPRVQEYDFCIPILNGHIRNSLTFMVT